MTDIERAADHLRGALSYLADFEQDGAPEQAANAAHHAEKAEALLTRMADEAEAHFAAEPA